MLNTEFDTYFKVEARMVWNIWDWGKIKREKQVIDLQSQIISTQKETFNQELKASLSQRIAEIEKYEKLIVNDQLIADLQGNVVKTADFQLKDGTITSTNYVIELNKLIKAQLNLEAHKLQLVFAKYQYITALGNL
jgi:outer membrane protein TolC